MMQVVPNFSPIQSNFYQPQQNQQHQQQQFLNRISPHMPKPRLEFDFNTNYLLTPEQANRRLRSSPFQVVPSPSGSYVSSTFDVNDARSPTMFSPTDTEKMSAESFRSNEMTDFCNDETHKISAKSFRPNPMNDFCNVELCRQSRLSSVDSSQTSVSPSCSTFYDSFQEMNDFISGQVNHR